MAEFDFLPGIYGFILQDRPNPDTGTMTFTEDVSGGATWTIIASGNPSAGQVRVDSERGICIFNVADNATNFLIDYQGAGTNATLSALQGFAQVPTQGVINALNEVTAPVDTDEYLIADTAATETKKITQANITNKILNDLFDKTEKTYVDPGDVVGIREGDSAAAIKSFDLGSFIRTGWQLTGETWTYSSTDAPSYVVTVPSDATTRFSVGMRVKLTDSGTQYFIITKVAATSITLYGGTDYTLSGGAITNVYYSTFKAPFGFPLDPSKWTETLTDTAVNSQASPVSGTWYNLGSLSISVPIGVWRIYTKMTCELARGAAGDIDLEFTLSTSSSAVSNTRFSVRNVVVNVTDCLPTLVNEFDLAVITKTTYYLLLRANSTGTNVVQTRGDILPTKIELVCAYL